MLLNLHFQKSKTNFLRTFFCLTTAVCFSSLLIAQTTLVDPQTSPQALPAANNLTAPWQLIFTDEFNDNTIDVSKWTVLESLTTRSPRPNLSINSWFWKPNNSFEENGNLVLRVDKVGANRMHCGALNSKDKFESLYGFYECRVKIADASKGTHTAFWFQGEGQSIIDGTANDGAEIDVFESAWLEDYTKAVLHIDGYGAATQANTKQYTTPGLHQGYHTFGMFWTPTYIEIYYDGILKTTFTGDKWKVNALEYIFLSDGASFGYTGDNFTVQPLGELTRAYFDYVRVWQLPDYECYLALKEIESMPSTPVSATKTVLANTSASGGQILRLNADAVGDEILLGPICHPQSGYYSYDLKAYKFTSFGKYKMSVEVSPNQWVLFDQELDLYGQSASATTNFGSVFLPAGSYRVKLTCTGKNSSSTGFFGSFDLLTLQSGQPPISCFISPTANVLWTAEAETGSYTGAAALQTCATASNNQYINLNVISVKRLNMNDITVPAAGRYLLKIDYISNGIRKARVEVNGESIGVVDFPSSGVWCFDGGSPASHLILVNLNQGSNTVSIVNSGTPLPIFDKFAVFTRATDIDDDGVPDTCDVDDDNDGLLDVNDNCSLIVNADQIDTDADGIGNACDDDDDNDGILDVNDNCALLFNADQIDTDADGSGNVCDDDDDNDGIMDVSDNCPLIPNADQLNTDGDGFGNVCDADDDNDSILDVNDNCPLVANINQLDTDSDGIGNTCDAIFNMHSFTDKILSDIGSLGLNAGNTQALTVSLTHSLSNCQQGNVTTCINNLNAFINKVEAHSGKKISVAMANYLIASATYAIQSISSGRSDCGLPTSLRQFNTIPVSDEELQSDEFSLFPNPFVSGNSIKINIPQNLAGKSQLVQIIELVSGRVVYSKLISAKGQQLSASLRLAAGIYIVRLPENNNYIPLKLVVFN